MRRLPILFIATLLVGCATEVDAISALKGKDISTATSLYGPWSEVFTTRDGEPAYLWRRSVRIEGRDYFCELRVEMGFRANIARSSTRGFPAACDQFRVHYETKLH